MNPGPARIFPLLHMFWQPDIDGDDGGHADLPSSPLWGSITLKIARLLTRFGTDAAVPTFARISEKNSF
jgi:hypothetical protein